MRPAYAAVDRGALTARGLDRVLRVAWTIADLNSLAVPGEKEVLRAMALRSRGEGS
jgi:magnesium chelatase family protein